MNNHNYTADLTSRQYFQVAVLAAAGVACTQLDATLTNSNMRYIGGGLGFTADEATWSAAGYLFTQLASIVMCTTLMDALNIRRFLLFLAFMFLASEVVCWLSFDLYSFIAGRIITGFCAGAFNTTTIILVLKHIPRERRIIAFLLFGLPSTLFIPVGYWLGGFFVNHLDWRDIYGTTSLMAVALFAGMYHLVEGATLRPFQPIKLNLSNWANIISVVITLFCISIVANRGTIENWYDSPMIILLTVAGVVSSIIFIVLEVKAKEPVIDFSLLKDSHFTAMMAVNFLFGSLLVYTSVIVSYLQNVSGYDSEQIGGTVLWAALVVPLILNFMKRVDHRVLIVSGLLLIAFSGFSNAMLNEYLVGDDFISSQIIRAAGQTFVLWPIFNMVLKEVPVRQQDSGAKFYSLSRALGVAFATAMLGASLTWRDNFHSQHAAERVSQSAMHAQAKILTKHFISLGSGRRQAAAQAVVTISKEVKTETRVRVYSDLFWMMGRLALFAILPLLFVSGNTGAESILNHLFQKSSVNSK
ncbi:MAG: MFS transporter [Candidatus Obscuribacterales bacterium]|nr:MFS transporter [Candidatus Obscuribacterales bacterium]